MYTLSFPGGMFRPPMRSFSKFFPVFFLLFSAATLASDAPEPPAPRNIPYIVPIEWIRMEDPGAHDDGYQTSFDKTRRLIVLIRAVDTGEEDPETWVVNQVDYMKNVKRVLVGTATEQFFGDTGWSYVDWADRENDERGRQYYLEIGEHS